MACLMEGCVDSKGMMMVEMSAVVDALLARRTAARKEKDYDTADALQAELKALGLYVDDKKRTYGAARAK